MTAWIKLLRPHQWAKNLLVFVGLIAAHRWADPAAWISAAQMFVALSLAASAVYVLNDSLDVEHDRLDPDKSRRPLASGAVSMRSAWLLLPVLLALALASAYALNPIARWAFLAYLFGALVYNLGIKRVLWLDVALLAALYALRVIAGALAIGVEPSPWLVGFSLFLFLSLACLKRYAELLRSSHQVLPGRPYRRDDAALVAAFGVACATCATVVLALYVNASDVQMLYRTPQWLWVLGPVVLMWLARMWTLAHRGAMPSDPVLFALTDRASWLTAAVFGAVLLLGK